METNAWINFIKSYDTYLAYIQKNMCHQEATPSRNQLNRFNFLASMDWTILELNLRGGIWVLLLVRSVYDQVLFPKVYPVAYFVCENNAHTECNFCDYLCTETAGGDIKSFSFPIKTMPIVYIHTHFLFAQ